MRNLNVIVDKLLQTKDLVVFSNENVTESHQTERQSTGWSDSLPA
jgi:hypothetical protein